MKSGCCRCLMVVAVGFALTAGQVMAGDSVLANAGFEAGTGTVADVWAVFGKNTVRANVNTHAGVYAGMASGDNTGMENFGGFFQEAKAREGQQWAGSLWMRHNADDPLKGTCEAFAKIEFYDSSGDYLDALESADRLTSASAVDTYIRSAVLSVAPPKTAWVRFVAMFAQYDGKSPGTVYFDDAELRRIETK
ncbi:MAG: hypothetical protein V1929_08730 [bacterium]